MLIFVLFFFFLLKCGVRNFYQWKHILVYGKKYNVLKIKMDFNWREHSKIQTKLRLTFTPQIIVFFPHKDRVTNLNKQLVGVPWYKLMTTPVCYHQPIYVIVVMTTRWGYVVIWINKSGIQTCFKSSTLWLP